MQFMPIAKKIVRTAITMSVGHVAGSLITNNLSPRNTFERAEVMLGSYVVGAMVADAAGDWTDRKMEELVDWWAKNNRF